MIRGFAPWLAVGLASLALLAAIGWRNATPRISPPVAIGGDFHLVDQNSRAVDQTLLNGKWTAIFFGYTYCPEVCPTTLQTLGGAISQLGPAANRLQVVFVTVDPQRDTPAQLKAYLSSAAFPRGTIGLTGTDAEVAAAAKAYGIYFQKQGEGANYSVDHSSAIYLMNPKGRFDSVIPYGLTPVQMRDMLAKAMGAPTTSANPAPVAAAPTPAKPAPRPAKPRAAICHHGCTHKARRVLCCNAQCARRDAAKRDGGHALRDARGELLRDHPDADGGPHGAGLLDVPAQSGGRDPGRPHPLRHHRCVRQHHAALRQAGVEHQQRHDQ